MDTYLDTLLGGVGQCGNIYFADPTSGSDGNDGKSPDEAKATLQAAIDLCTDNNGDLIIRMRGGEEVTETVAFNCPGITVITEGYGASPTAMGELFSTYAASTFTDGPAATITERCTLVGLGFVSRDTGATFYGGAAALIGGTATANPFGVHLIDCRFPKWNLDNRIGLAIEGSSDCTIEHCFFEGVGADFDSGIYVQGATQNLEIVDCRFRDCTYGIVFGSFAGGGPEAIIHSNIFEGSKCLSAGSAATAILSDNWMMTATDTGSYNATVNTLNGYGIQMADQHYAE